MPSSLFSTYECEIGDNEIVLATEYCLAQTLLAVATSCERVLIFNTEESNSILHLIKGKSNASCIAWKPSCLNLVIGWEDGLVEYYSIKHDERILCNILWSNNTIHTHAFNIIIWDFSGKHLVTADKGGTCCLWKVDNNLVTPTVHTKSKSEITAAVFVPNYPQKSNRKISELSEDTSNPICFGTGDGTVSMMDVSGKIYNIKRLSSKVDSMLVFETKNRIIIFTRSFCLIQLDIKENGTISQLSNVRVSVSGEPLENGICHITWVAPGVIASATREKFIRFWDLNTDDNFVLPLHSAGVPESDKVTVISFNPFQRQIAAGTTEGRCIIWKWITVYETGSTTTGEALRGKLNWENSEVCPHLHKTPIQSLKWGPRESIFISFQSHTFIMREDELCCSVSDQVAAIQVGKRLLRVQRNDFECMFMVTTTIDVKNIVIDSRHLVVWDGRQICVYKLYFDNYEKFSNFPFHASSIALFNDSLFIAQDNQIIITNLNGVQRLSIPFPVDDGRPVHLNICRNFLAVATQFGYLKLFDVSMRDPQSLLATRGKFIDSVTNEHLGSIKSIKCNSNGTKISILSDLVNHSLNYWKPTSKLYIYDSCRNEIEHVNFGPKETIPLSHFWDTTEPNLLSCETYSIKQTNLAESMSDFSENESSKLIENGDVLIKKHIQDSQKEVVMMFVTDSGIFFQDRIQVQKRLQTFVGLQAPKLFFSELSNENKNDNEHSLQISLATILMRYFTGFENGDEAMKTTLMNFFYNLTVGNIDKAYQSVRPVKNPAIWENMAQMCINAERLDVAELCLSKMEHSRGAEVARHAKSDPLKEVALAAVAIQLGQLEIATQLYRRCKRYDLLNKLLQKQGLWKTALDIAKSCDQIHLKTTHFEYAKHLENIGDFSGAKSHFELAGVHEKEVVRMFLQVRSIEELENYIEERNDPNLFRWLGSYHESCGNLKEAHALFSKASDCLSLVRLACVDDGYDVASSIVRQTNDPAATYQLGLQYEGEGKFHIAVTLYSKSGLLNHAIRLAKIHSLYSELMKLAMRSDAQTMMECAYFFERKHEYELAVQLYLKSGRKKQAITLCLDIGENATSKKEMVQIFVSLVDKLCSDCSASIIERFVDYLVICGHYGRAVELLCTKCYCFEQALDICIRYDVQLTDSIVDILTPPKHEMVDSSRRVKIIENIAVACKNKKQFHLACKKFTQSGDKVKAIKCLIKSGDTRKIISYANLSKNRDIYIIAANYLQTLDWYDNNEITEAIVCFYTCARAFEQILTFFNACAQIEIDEYSDYDKALGALKEALKYTEEIKNSKSNEVIFDIQNKASLVEQFLEAKKCIGSNPQIALKTCRQLLSKNDVEMVIHAGDCFGLMASYHLSKENYEEVLVLIGEMRSRGIVPEHFIDELIIQKIYQSDSFETFPSSKTHEECDESENCISTIESHVE